MKSLIKLAVSCAFFLLLLSFINTNELLALFADIDWFYVGLSFGLIPVMLLASCLKWKVILDLNEKKLSLFNLLRIYLIGYLFSNILPSTVGGDVMRSYYTGKRIENQAFSAVAVFLERFTGILLLLVLVIVAPLFKPQLYASPYVYVPATCSAMLLLVLGWLMISDNPLTLPKRLFHTIREGLLALSSRPGLGILARLTAMLDNLVSALFTKLDKAKTELRNASRAIKTDRAVLTKIVLLTVLFYLLTWVNVYVSLRAFGNGYEFLAICALVPVAMFVAHVPVTLLGNLGYFESVFVFYFLLINIPGAETLAMGLLLRVKMLTTGGAGYISYLLYAHPPLPEHAPQSS